jgi:hypothetical protein
MSERMSWRERSLWMALVAALSMSLGWLAVLGLLALNLHSLPAPPVALARAIARVLLAVARVGWPILPLAIVTGMMAVLAIRQAALPRRKVRHA